MTIRESLQENLRQAERVNALLQSCPALAEAEGNVVCSLIYINSGLPLDRIPAEWQKRTVLGDDWEFDIPGTDLHVTIKNAARQQMPLEREAEEWQQNQRDVRAALIDAAEQWPGNLGLDWDKVATKDIALLIRDSAMPILRRKISPAQQTENQTNTETTHETERSLPVRFSQSVRS